MALLTVQQITKAGLAPTYAAAAGGGDTFAVGQGQAVFLHVKNASGSPITVTVDDPNSQPPESAATFNPDLSVSVPATTGDRMIGPINAERFVNPSTGLVSVTYSGVTSLTVGVFKAN
jgi:hypothetical protein